MNYIWWYLSVKKMPNVSLKMTRWRFVSNEIISADFCQIHLIFVTFFKQFEFMLSWNQLKCDILSNFQIMCAPTFWSFRTSPFAPRKKSTDVNIWKRKWWNYHAYVVYESNTDNLLTCPPPLRVSHGFSLWLSYEASNLKTIIQMIAACLLWLLLLLSAHDFPHHPRISDIKMWAAIWRPSKVPQATLIQQPVNCTIRQSKTHPTH